MQFHGDIRPFNVLITSSREYKVIDSKLFDRATLPTYFSQISGLNEGGYLFSPAIFAHLGTLNTNGYEKLEDNVYKSDVFSIAMTVLECASLERAAQFYNWETYQIDFTALESKLQGLKEIYSSSLIDTLRLMLKADEDERPDFVQIDSELSAYKEDIKARVLHKPGKVIFTFL